MGTEAALQLLKPSIQQYREWVRCSASAGGSRFWASVCWRVASRRPIHSGRLGGLAGLLADWLGTVCHVCRCAKAQASVQSYILFFVGGNTGMAMPRFLWLIG